MNWTKSKVKNAFVVFEEKVLSVRDHLSTLLHISKRHIIPSFENNEEVLNGEGDSNLVLLDDADQKKSCCKLYMSNYDGTTCLYQRATGVFTNCFSPCSSVVEFTNNIFGCIINLLCYPFIPCAIAFLPASFQFAGYTNVNSLYPCYGKTCCFCIANQEKGCLKFFCSPICCFILLSICLVASCLWLWNETQTSLIVIDVLLYFENLNQAASVFLFVIAFTLVSFPIMWGYVFFNLAAGYLYGFGVGLAVVIFSVTIGLSISHIVCKKYFSTCVMNLLRRRTNFDQIEAILQVIDGSSGLKVITLTRLTPIPFGFQNGLFAVSNVSMKYYLLASDVGLLPTQVLNCYIASKFRSMDEILDQESPKGYLLFFAQVAIGVALMMFVVQKARKELAKALQSSKTLCRSDWYWGWVILRFLVKSSTMANDDTSTTGPIDLENIKCTQPVSINKLPNDDQRSILDV